MSAVHSGRIAGDDLPGAASALAGLLAEMGIADLAIADDQGWVRLAPRETDLPGVLMDVAPSGRAELMALDRSLRVEIRPDGLRWFTGPGPLADALLSISATD